MKTIKFKRKGNILEWSGAGGLWRDGQVKTLRDDVADRLLGLYDSPFVLVAGKDTHPESDKMVRGAPETKEVDVKDIKKIKGENKKTRNFGNGWRKKKK